MAVGVPIIISVEDQTITLAYEEPPSAEFAAPEAQLVNIYFVATGKLREDGFVARSARLIVDIWIIDLAHKTKTCYQWRLSDVNMDGFVDEVAGEIVMENQEDTVTEIRPLQTSHRNMDDYSRLFKDCLDQFLQNLKLPSLDALFRLPDRFVS
jgi:hypothetical protein